MLQGRDENKLVNTDKESQLFAPQGSFYKDIAEKMVETGVCVDLFLFPNAPVDLATIGTVAGTTGGDTLFYPNFAAPKDGYRFQEDLKRLLQREFGFEGVMRIRCSDGLRVVEHFGNFHMRNATDVELAGIDSEKALAVQLGHTGALDEKLNCVFQCALLYTRSDGQRRIRVHNLSVPATSVMGNLFRYADMDTCVNYLLKAAMAEAMTTSLKSVGDQLTDKCVRVLAAYRKHCAAASSPGQYFGVDTLEAIDASMTTIPHVDSPLSHKLQAIVAYIQSRRARHLALRIVRQQLDPSEMEFAALLVEDKNNDHMSYVDYLCHVHRQIQTEVSTT
ncbi:hypothetical protein SYNPS1DRAFT_31035 [Syncephalis pseudoplumigaleata]|uniref:Uncharacterized protein n=1 Tax=Syncephalis pseudoplumigaleata TaxID=1712513 RepID=A0A4V1J0Z2_9FUNG|nr:hypothetical protein SYNPS1DRAFT_31035 [Syncephalis pseudoplumigaleata]|eukprot:RKP23249.1 hypothetical protein SYNPS1DRAFT_31035 [Syncephalis pseudoplumigaleata]